MHLDYLHLHYKIFQTTPKYAYKLPISGIFNIKKGKIGVCVPQLYPEDQVCPSTFKLANLVP